jgi:GDPmannose 4,6-dehydratase
MDISWHGKGAREVGKDRKGKVIVRVNPEFYRPRETNNFLGDASKARRVLGWKPKVGFKELVHMMAEHDFKVLSSGR